MYTCSICQKSFSTGRALGGHKRSHLEKKQVAEIENVEKFSNCHFCGKTVKSRSLGIHTVMCIKNPKRSETIRKQGENRSSLSDSHKEKLSLKMKVAHSEGRAWNIGKSRWNNEPSYPEKFFEKVILNEFENKDYVKEYAMGIYSLDFAWPTLKRAIEIDGDQHQRFEEYRARDERKDAYAREHEWKLLRIVWKEMYHNTKEKIAEAKIFIKGE